MKAKINHPHGRFMNVHDWMTGYTDPVHPSPSRCLFQPKKGFAQGLESKRLKKLELMLFIANGGLNE